MNFVKLTASTAALLLSSSALMAQDSPTMQSVFIDVGGTAVLVPMDVALEACGLDEATLQTTAQARIDESGIDQTQFMAQMDSAMGMMNGGDAATQDSAAADAGTTGTGDASGTMTTEGTASADASDAAAGAAGMDASGGVSDTTQTADANATTDSGNATTDMGNTTDTATADASGAAAGDAATSTDMTDTATADASGAAGQDATAVGEVQNVESTAADTTAAAGATGSANADPFVTLAACQIDQTRANELQVDMTRTGGSLGFDAATLGLETGMTSQ